MIGLYAIVLRAPAGAVGARGESLRAIDCGEFLALAGDPPAPLSVDALRAHEAAVRRIAEATEACLPARFGATPTLQTRPESRRLFALVMIPLALATALAPLGSGGEPVCGVAVEIQDPGVRASFARFDRQQSAGAAEICAHYRDERPVL